MSDIRLEREFKVSPARLFYVLTSDAQVLQWWGHDGWVMQDAQLDFTRTGPWYSVMLGEDGTLFKMSGVVTKVQPVETIGFTWAWHDGDDVRGHESHVTFTIQETSTGSKLVIDHRDLPTDENAASHARGWASPLGRLERLLQT